MALSLGTAVAAAVTVPLTDAMGGSWRLGLGVWAAPGRRRRAAVAAAGTGQVRSAAARRSRTGAAPAHGAHGRITRSRTARMLACLTSGSRPPPPTSRWAGCRRSSGTPGSPRTRRACCSPSPWRWACRCRSCCRRWPPGCARRARSWWCSAAFQLAGFAGLWAAPAAAPWVWALLLGVANCAFPLVLTMIGMRARTGPGVVTAVGLRAEHRLPDLHPRPDPGRRAQPVQRRLGPADRADGRTGGAAGRLRGAGRPRPAHRGRTVTPVRDPADRGARLAPCPYSNRTPRSRSGGC